MPKAKIISVTRNPVDTCFSNYKQVFETAVQMASYDLENIANQYACYIELMEHWKSVFGDRIYQLSYEQLVNNQQTETRKLVDFCQLNWHTVHATADVNSLS